MFLHLRWCKKKQGEEWENTVYYYCRSRRKRKERLKIRRKKKKRNWYILKRETCVKIVKIAVDKYWWCLLLCTRGKIWFRCCEMQKIPMLLYIELRVLKVIAEG